MQQFANFTSGLNFNPNAALSGVVSIFNQSSSYLPNIPDISSFINQTVPYELALTLGFFACGFFILSIICLASCFCRCRPPKIRFTNTQMDHNLKNYGSQGLKDFKDLPGKDYGQIFYTLDYVLNSNILNVGVKKIENMFGDRDVKPVRSFVTVRLHPKFLTQQTRVSRLTKNPHFDEVFDFSMTMKNQRKCTLMFGVYSNHAFKRPVKLSQLHLPLGGVQLGEMIEEFSGLEPPTLTENETSRGEVCISMRYLPNIKIINILVVEAKDLCHESCKNPQVKINMYIEDKIVKKKKTKSEPISDTNPYFNESFNFSIDIRKMKKTEFVIKVEFKNKWRSSSDNIGEFCIGGSKLGVGLKHWLEMMEKPGYPVAMWHALYPADSDTS